MTTSWNHCPNEVTVDYDLQGYVFNFLENNDMAGHSITKDEVMRIHGIIELGCSDGEPLAATIEEALEAVLLNK